MSDKSLTDLISHCHREIREIFMLHQEALLMSKFDQANTLFSSFKACHELHKHFEDESLIPVFAGLSEQGKWPASVYEKEHDKIGRWIDRLERDMNNLAGLKLNKRQERQNIIALIDREKSFKGLTEHHEEREEDAMLPALDKQADHDWRQDIMENFTTEWQRVLAEQKRVIKEIVDSWDSQDSIDSNSP